MDGACRRPRIEYLEHYDWELGSLFTSVNRTPQDAALLYHQLERVVVPLYYGNRDRFIEVMRHAIALNASHFNTQRMVQEFIVKAHFQKA